MSSEPSPFLISRGTGVLMIVSGPSGSGKTTICRSLAASEDCWYSVSCTTRKPRPGEVHGQDYFFLSREEFEARVGAGDFLEFAEVHGNLYGTLRERVLERIEAGKDVVMDLDVQGAEQLRTNRLAPLDVAAVDVFVMPGSHEELGVRLTNRGTETPEVFALRMSNALDEMQNWPLYDYLIVSGSREEDFAAARSILHAERLRVSRRRPVG